AEANGLEVPVLPPHAQARVGAGAPGAATVANPVDLGAAATPEAFRDTIAALAASGAVDSVVAVFALTGANDVAGVLAALRDAVDQVSLRVAVVLLGVPDQPAVIGVRRAPVYDLPEQAVTAIARAVGYARWRATPAGRRPELSDVDTARGRRIAAGALRDH